MNVVLAKTGNNECIGFGYQCWRNLRGDKKQLKKNAVFIATDSIRWQLTPQNN